MAGLVPAIHVFGSEREDVDARNKCGDDETNFVIASVAKESRRYATIGPRNSF